MAQPPPPPPPQARYVNHRTVETVDDDAIRKCKQQLVALGSSVHFSETTDGYECHLTPNKDMDVREVLARLPDATVFAAKRTVVLFCEKNAVRRRSFTQVFVGVVSVLAAIYLTFARVTPFV